MGAMLAGTAHREHAPGHARQAAVAFAALALAALLALALALSPACAFGADSDEGAAPAASAASQDAAAGEGVRTVAPQAVKRGHPLEYAGAEFEETISDAAVPAAAPPMLEAVDGAPLAEAEADTGLFWAVALGSVAAAFAVAGALFLAMRRRCDSGSGVTGV